MKRLSLLALALFLLIGASPQKQEPPVEIRSMRLDADYGKGVLVFSGAVNLKKGEFFLQSDKLTVYLKTANGTNEVDWAEATGEVHMSYGQKRARCGRAVYYAQEEKVLLEEDPIMWEGDNRLRGKRITIFLKEERAIVESGPGKPVELTVVEKGDGKGLLPRP